MADDQVHHRPKYAVAVHEPAQEAGTLVFTFVPKGDTSWRNGEGGPKRVPQFIVRVTCRDSTFRVDWVETSDDPKEERAAVEQEALRRAEARAEWIDRVTELVRQVDVWAKELGWETRRIDKRLEDSQVGAHVVPALLLQKETCRVLLEPVGRSAPGADGIVDLYLMPAYDDIASLYFDDGVWNLHQLSPNASPASGPREAAKERLSREALGRTLEGMRAHASST